MQFLKVAIVTTIVIMKIIRFNIRLLSVYAPTKSEISGTKKDSFYKLLNKTSQKQENIKSLSLLVISVLRHKWCLKKCCYDETYVVPDDDCNNNKTRLKIFCMCNRYKRRWTLMAMKLQRNMFNNTLENASWKPKLT